MSTKLLIIGGHLTPALALIEYLQVQQPQITTVFVGRRYSQDASQQLSQEQAEVEQRGVTFIPFATARVNGALSFLTQLPKFISSLYIAQRLLNQEKPDAVISFGGYLAVPLALMAWVHRIPVITHEQTRTIGLATQLISIFADTIAVSFPETVTALPAHKTVVVGNPLRQELLAPPVAPNWDLPTTKPWLYITGGNQGSVWINQAMQALIPQLLNEWVVIHQCGNATTHHDAKTELTSMRDQLPPELKMQYLVKEWFTTTEVAWLYRHATAVVSRAGANTIQELQHFGLPAVLIPLPSSRRDEQDLNAQHLVKLGGAIKINQRQTTSTELLAAITELRSNHAQYRAHLEAVPIPTDAAARLWAVIATCLTKSHA